MSREDDIRKLITEKRRRLQKLQEKQAKMGINTPPEILTEIEDIIADIDELQAELAELDEVAIQTRAHGDTYLSQYQEAYQDNNENTTKIATSLLEAQQNVSPLEAEYDKLNKELAKVDTQLKETYRKIDFFENEKELRDKLKEYCENLITIQQGQDLSWTLTELEDIEGGITEDLKAEIFSKKTPPDFEKSLDILKEDLEQLRDAVRDDLIFSSIDLAKEYEANEDFDRAALYLEDARWYCEQFEKVREEDKIIRRLATVKVHQAVQAKKNRDKSHAIQCYRDAARLRGEIGDWQRVERALREVCALCREEKDVKEELEAQSQRLEALEKMEANEKNLKIFTIAIRRVYELSVQSEIATEFWEQQAYEAAVHYYRTRKDFDNLREVSSLAKDRGLIEVANTALSEMATLYGDDKDFENAIKAHYERLDLITNTTKFEKKGIIEQCLASICELGEKLPTEPIAEEKRAYKFAIKYYKEKEDAAGLEKVSQWADQRGLIGIGHTAKRVRRRIESLKKGSV